MFKNLILLLCSLSLLGGCKSGIVVPSNYTPEDNVVIKVNAQVVLNEVVDKREAINERKYYSYYMDLYGYDSDFFDGFYDKPVREIVREALITEFRKAGVDIVKNSSAIPNGAVRLKCEIVKYNLAYIGKLTGKNEAEEVIALQFKWTDPATDMLIEANRRKSRSTFILTPLYPNSKSHSTVIQDSFNFIMPKDRKSVRESGSHLLNVHLPKVIRAELRMSKSLNKK